MDHQLVEGITESANSAGEEFGHARLEAELRRARAGASGGSQAEGADAMLFSLLGAVEDFAASSPLVDDTSLAIVRRG